MGATQGDTKELVVRLPSDLHAQVKDRADNDDRTIAATIRVALRQFLAEPSPLT